MSSFFSGFVSAELASAVFRGAVLQERDDGCATGLGALGGMNVGGAPRSSAWRKLRARTSSFDFGDWVTRSPIWQAPPSETPAGAIVERGRFTRKLLRYLEKLSQ